MATLLEQARLLVAAGPFDARAAEVVAVHAGIWPTRDAVCPTCRAELGRAFFAIKRWTEQQGAASDAPLSPSFMHKPTVVARFKSDSTVYTPHGLGVAYSNANLTDKAARDILAADPDAAEYFSTLPPADDSEPAASQPEADAAPAASPTTTLPDGIDYTKLASALADEFERRQSTHDVVPATTTKTVTLTAQPGGQGADGVTSASTPPATVEVTTGTTADTDTEEHDEDDKPVRLSRMTKDQLRATHLAEVGSEAHAEATNDELREAIATKRASLPTE